MLRIDRRFVQTLDWPVLLLSFCIPLMALVVLYSAGYDPDQNGELFFGLPTPIASLACAKQALFLGAGIVVMVIGMAIPAAVLQRYSIVVYGAGLILLLLVSQFGTVVNGSRRWLNLGAFNLQPAELMKMGVILALARVLAKMPPRSPTGYSLRELILPGGMVLIPMLLIMKQPDLGSALSLGIVGFGMILFMGVRWKSIVLAATGVIAMAYPFWLMLHDYQKRRILVLLNPEADPQGSGYHILQSKIAVGSGSLSGKGFLQGTQTQLEFLPEHTTDFVFSVLAEEWGFMGSSVLIVLFFLLVAGLLRVAARTKDLFSSLVVIGITTKIFAHSIINIGMVIGLMPVVGIPLPLFSYGGSSLLSLMFALGLVQGVSMRRGGVRS